MSVPVYISAAVEGLVDEAVICKLIEHAGGKAGPVYGKGGKTALRSKLDGYNHAARHAPWVVLVDLDQDHDCAPPFRMTWMPAPADGLCFRIAVRAVEAWLLADSKSIGRFFGVATSKVPASPENLSDPKQALVELARGSRWRAMRSDMVPREGSGRSVGPAYTSRVIEFVDTWRPREAAAQADSLRRAIECLRRLIEDAGASGSSALQHHDAATPLLGPQRHRRVDSRGAKRRDA
jgi:hypothetical protein